MDADAARDFIYRNARRVDRACFDRTDDLPDDLPAALAAYRNPDGGFGHALEADVRCATSQPLHTETALGLLRSAGVQSREWANAASDYLEALAGPDCALPTLTADAFDAPTAGHWNLEGATAPTLHRTYLLATYLHWHGADHPFAHRAREACAAALPNDRLDEAHVMIGAIAFAHEVMADRSLVERLITDLHGLPYFIAEPPIKQYGLTPLNFAPEPGRNPGFDAAHIRRHLEWLASEQLDDGGWPVRFDPVGAGALMEWRGRFTVEAITILRAWGYRD